MDVNVALAEWSNLLIYSAMAVYAVAFIVYAFDLFGPAFAGDLETEQSLKESRNATTAGTKAGRAKTGSAKSAAEGADSSGRAAAGSRAGGAAATSAASSTGLSAGGGASSGAAATATMEADSADRASAANGGKKSDGDPNTRTPDLRRWARAGTALTVLAALLHIASVVTRTLAVMRVPWSNMMEYALIASALVVVGYLIFVSIRDVRYLGTFVTLSVLLVLGLCITVFHTPVAQVIPALDNYWIWIHVPIAILSTVLLYLSALVAVVQLLRSRSESKPWGGILRFVNLLPSSKDLEKVSYRLAAVGFITWTFTLVAGAFWAEIAWGRYWGWDSKEIWTFVVWVVYAAYMHARATRGWTASRVAVLNLVGISTVIFNFAVVNLYFNGLHAYSGV